MVMVLFLILNSSELVPDERKPHSECLNISILIKSINMKNYQVMTFNASVLIALGVFGYVTSGSPTALIAPAVGIILLALAIPVKKENSVAAHIGVGLTGLTTIIFFVVGIIRGNSIIILMAVVTLIALIFYVSDFIKRKREREANTNQK
jgi:hypothetical protein